MMKKTAAVVLTATMITSSVPVVFAENEAYNEYDVTMTVKNNVINRTNEKLFGVNMEWQDGSMRKDTFLDHNYGRHSSFENNFENPSYYRVPMEVKEAYYAPDSDLKFKYIANGDTYGGNLSASTYMAKSGKDLYENQYDESGVLQKPKAVIGGVKDYVMSTIIKDSVLTGGDENFQAWSSSFALASDLEAKNIEDLNVVTDKTDETNHVLKLAPNYKQASYFSKNFSAILDRKATYKFRVMVESDHADVRLGITKDWNTEHIKEVEDRKYLTGATQFMRVYYYTQKYAWFDAVQFKNGKILLAGDEVGEYDKDEWYSVEYVFDDIDDTPSNSLLIKDSSGTVVVDEVAPVVFDRTKNGGLDSTDIRAYDDYTFELDSKSVYGYTLFAGATTVDSRSYGTTAYIDDVSYSTQGYLRPEGTVIDARMAELKNDYVFPYARMAGNSAMSIDWQKAVGDVKERERYLRYEGSPYDINRQYFGIPEWLKMVDYMNPEAEYSFVINYKDSDEKIAELVEYLVGDGDITGDGVDWSAVRKADGIEHPARVSMWEVGNEPSFTMEVSDYLERASSIVDLLNRLTPDIPIGIPTNESEMGVNLSPGNTGSWMDEIVTWDKAPDIDYIVFHSYQSYNSWAGRVPNFFAETAEGWINSESSKNKNLKIAYTEHGTSQPWRRDHYWKGIGLAAALDDAIFYNRMFTEPIIEIANLHSYNLYPGPWGIGYEDEGKYIAGANLHVLTMYAENGIGDVLETEMEGYLQSRTGDHGLNSDGTWKEGKYGYTCSAVKADDGTVNIFISNNRNHKLNLNLELPTEFDNYEVTEKQVVTGKAEDTFYSYDGWVSYPVEQTGTDTEGNPTFRYEDRYAKDMVYKTDYAATRDNLTIDPYSVTLIKLADKSLSAAAGVYDGKQRVDIAGTVEDITYDNHVSLLIKTKATGMIKHMDQVEVNSDKSYRFNFELDEDIANCDVIIRYGGVTQNINGKVAKLDNAEDMFELNVGTAQHMSVSGTVADIAYDRRVTLLAQNRSTGEIVHMAETNVDENKAFSFEFPLMESRKNCKLLVRYGGVTKDISGLEGTLNDSDGSVTVATTTDAGEITAELNNRLGFKDLYWTMIVASYDKYQTEIPASVSISGTGEVKLDGNHQSVQVDRNAAYYNLFIWRDMENATPLVNNKLVLN